LKARERGLKLPDIDQLALRIFYLFLSRKRFKSLYYFTGEAFKKAAGPLLSIGFI
jgi:hypothetical protein